MEPDALILWCLAQLRTRRRWYDLYEAYYDGRHRLAFSSDRVRDAFGDLFRAFSLNLCPVVVDALADRLQVIGFSEPGREAADDVQAVWERNRMPGRHGRVHRDALVLGDAYFHVWQDRDGLVRVYDESPRETIVRYDDDRPGELEGAVKCWRAGKFVRVTAYFRDRIERYITRAESDQIPAKMEELRPLDEGDVPLGVDARPVVQHGWGIVPVFHLANNPGHNGLGRSELRDVIAVQDALNKTVADLLVMSESHALPLRYLIGVDVETDPLTGRTKPLFSESQDRVVALPKDSQPGQWDPASAEQVLSIKREFAADVARVSGVPMHTLMQVTGSDWPSGLALRTSEARLTAKARDRTGDWGPSWADGMTLGARMRAGGEREVRTLWASVETPLSDLEVAEAAEAKQRAGIPRAQTWREMGYSETQITEFTAAYEAEQADRAARQQAAFDAGAPSATGGF